MKNSFGNIITDNEKFAEFFNFTFINLGLCNGENNAIGNDENIEHSKPFGFQCVNEKLTRKIIRELNPRKPLGPCTVPAWAIKDGQEILISHITFITVEYIKTISLQTSLSQLM